MNIKKVLVNSRMLIISFLIISIGICGYSFSQCLERIPPDSLTVTRMHVIKRRIIQFAHTNGYLPDKLSMLPILSGYDNKLTDGWGKPIQYAFDSDGLVTLATLGKIGKLNGIVRRFPAKNPDGSWAAESVDWLTK